MFESDAVVHVHDRQHVDAETFETAFDRTHDGAGEIVEVRRFESDLRCDYRFCAEFAQRFAEMFLRERVAVDRRRVEERNAAFERAFDRRAPFGGGAAYHEAGGGAAAEPDF